MELTRSVIRTNAEAYSESQPLAAVEREHRDILPEMLAGGEFGWRDVEWVVQWYFRRYLGAYPDRERRDVEAAFGENGYEEVNRTLSAVARTGGVGEKLRRLRELDGVDVPVGSAFLQFMFPGEYLALGSREWRVLREAGRLEGAYPEPPSIEDYRRYHESCRAVAGACEVDMWTLYRALWRLGSEFEA